MFVMREDKERIRSVWLERSAGNYSQGKPCTTHRDKSGWITEWRQRQQQ